MVISSPAEMDMMLRLRVNRAVPDVIKNVSDWEGGGDMLVSISSYLLGLARGGRVGV